MLLWATLMWFHPVLRLSPTLSLQTTPTPWNNWLKSCSSWKINWRRFLETHPSPPRMASTSSPMTTWTKTPATAPSSSERQELRAGLRPDLRPLWRPLASRTPRALHTRPPRKTKAAAKSTPFSSGTHRQHRESRHHQHRHPATNQAKLPEPRLSGSFLRSLPGLCPGQKSNCAVIRSYFMATSCSCCCPSSYYRCFNCSVFAISHFMYIFDVKMM